METDCYIYNGDCAVILPTIAERSIDLCLTDPPYPEIERSYGRWTEAQWHDLMDTVVVQIKRVLKPRGSALFILQPNSRKVGSMRLWLWEFVVRTAKQWNLVQDCYWWNFTTPPNVHCQRKRGLMRPSVKYCLWFGAADCYRNQDEVLWTPSVQNAQRFEDKALRYQPCGMSIRNGRALQTAQERGGSTPFNLLPISASNSVSSSGALGHGAGTPYKLCEWWVKYASPPGGTVLDPFAGAGTIPLAAVNLGRKAIGIETDPNYCAISRRRIDSGRKAS